MLGTAVEKMRKKQKEQSKELRSTHWNILLSVQFFMAMICGMVHVCSLLISVCDQGVWGELEKSQSLKYGGVCLYEFLFKFILMGLYRFKSRSYQICWW